MFTIYSAEENRFQLAEEPDPSLSDTYVDSPGRRFEEPLVPPPHFELIVPVRKTRKDHPTTSVVQPDTCIICNASIIDRHDFIGAPDLVSEILSPGNHHKKVKLNHEIYEHAKMKENWVIYSAEENIAVFALNKNSKYKGTKIGASDKRIQRNAAARLIINLNEIFTK